MKSVIQICAIKRTISLVMVLRMIHLLPYKGNRIGWGVRGEGRGVAKADTANF